MKNISFNSFFTRLACVCFIMVLPLAVMLAVKWPRSNDLWLYLQMVNAFSEQLWSGEPYPRWFDQLNGGYGSAMGIFYSPLAFYALSLLPFPESWDPNGFARFTAGVYLVQLLAGFTCRRWLRGHFTENWAQKGALLYAAFPYLPVIIYYNYAMASLLAIALFPLCLSALDRLAPRSWRGIGELAVSVALLCLAHVPSLATFMAVPVLYTIAFAPRAHRLRHMAQAAVGAALGAGLSAAYLLPMLFNRPFILSAMFAQGRFSYDHNFFKPDSAFGLCIIVLPLVGLYLEQPRASWNRATAFWAATLGLVFFMVTPFSAFIWRHAAFLQNLQFPMRFYNAMLPGAVFLAVSWLPQARSRHVYGVLFAAMLLYTGVTSWVTWYSDERPSAAAKTFLATGMNTEFHTLWMEGALPDPADTRQAHIAEGGGVVDIRQWSARSIRVDADVSPGGARVVLHRFYFPGWTGLGVETQPYHGLLSLRLAEGKHDITLSCELAGERLGERISAAALGTVLIMAWLACKRPRTA